MYSLIKIVTISYVSLLLYSCGGGIDFVDEIIEVYPGGEKKVYVKFYPENNILERFTYNRYGEMVYFEIDSLMKKDLLKNYLEGEWQIKIMELDEDTIFTYRKDDTTNYTQNLYTFSKDSLIGFGTDYEARYKIKYFDSLKVSFKGTWNFEDTEYKTHRLQSVNDTDYFQILSYDEFQWLDWLNLSDREEKVIFKRYKDKSINISSNPQE